MPRLFLALLPLAVGFLHVRADEPVIFRPKLRIGSSKLVHPHVRHMAFSPTGKWLATTGVGRTIVWSTQTGDETWHADLDADDLFFPGDNELLLVDGKRLASFDLTTRKENWSLPLARFAPPEAKEERRLRAVFSVNGKWLLLSWRDAGMVVLSVEKKEAVGKRWDNGELPQAWTISQDGRCIARAVDGDLSIFDVQSGKVIAEKPADRYPDALDPSKKGKRVPIGGLRFLRDGSLFVASATTPAILELPDLKVKRAIRLPALPRPKMKKFDSSRRGESWDSARLALSVDESLVIAPTSLGVKVVEAESGKVRFETTRSMFSNVMLSPDNRLLVLGVRPLRLHDLRTGVEVSGPWERLEKLVHAFASGDGKSIVTVNNTGDATFWSSEGTRGRTLALGWQDVGVNGITAGSKKLLVSLPGNTMQIRDLAELKVESILDLGRGEIPGHMTCLAEDDRTLAHSFQPSEITGGKHLVRVYREGKPIQSIPVGDQVVGLRLSPNGKRLFVRTTGSLDGALHDVTTGKVIASVPRVYEPHAVFSPGGNTLYYLDIHGNVHALREGKTRTLLEAHAGREPRELSLAGRFLAVGDRKGDIVLIDTATGKQHFRLKGHLGPIRSLHFNVEHGLLVSTGDDARAMMWELKAIGGK